jgi:translocation and assembly module TamB
VQSGTSDEDTAVVVGKQLSERLYVDYLYGLFNETAAVQFVYKLTKHLSLAGQSGAEQSIDLRLGISRH